MIGHLIYYIGIFLGSDVDEMTALAGHFSVKAQRELRQHFKVVDNYEIWREL